MINGANSRIVLIMSESRWRLSKEHGLVIDGITVCTPLMVCANGIIIENNPSGASYLRLTIRMEEPLTVAPDVPFNIGTLKIGMNEEVLGDPESYGKQGH